jgi:hypothetical protein
MQHIYKKYEYFVTKIQIVGKVLIKSENSIKRSEPNFLSIQDGLNFLGGGGEKIKLVFPKKSCKLNDCLSSMDQFW